MPSLLSGLARVALAYLALAPLTWRRKVVHLSVALWRGCTRGELAGWLPPLLVASGLFVVHFASASSLWQARLEPCILAATIGASPALIGARLLPTAVAWPARALGMALVGLLFAPTVWSVTSLQAGAGGAWLPAAAPSGVASGAGGFRGNPPCGGP
jgi:hypothetical protein